MADYDVFLTRASAHCHMIRSTKQNLLLVAKKCVECGKESQVVPFVCKRHRQKNKKNEVIFFF